MYQSTSKEAALIKITHHLLQGARNYLETNGFINVEHVCNSFTNITGSCESVNSLFSLDYYGNPAYLNQSAQLTIEMWTQLFGKVYCIVKSFRKEKNDPTDKRRLSEFTLIELEMLGDLDFLINKVTNVVNAMIRTVNANCAVEVNRFLHKTEIPEITFKRISYKDAIYLINDEFPLLAEGDDLQAEHEAAVYKKLGPCFITHYNREIKFFNMKDNMENPRIVNSADMILSSGESGGMSERETNFHKICEKLTTSSMYNILKSQGVKDSDFDKYLNFHLQNPQPNVLQAYRDTPELLFPRTDLQLHSGVGLGFQRIIQHLLQLDDIKKSCIHPRTAQFLE